MTMAGLDGYGFVLRERALAAFRVLANHGLVGRKTPQPPDFRDGDRGLFPRVFVALDVHEELLAVMFCHGGAVAFCFNCVFHVSDGRECTHLTRGRTSRPVRGEIPIRDIPLLRRERRR
jgi:hypothetical protein